MPSVTNQLLIIYGISFFVTQFSTVDSGIFYMAGVNILKKNKLNNEYFTRQIF